MKHLELVAGLHFVLMSKVSNRKRPLPAARQSDAALRSLQGVSGYVERSKIGVRASRISRRWPEPRAQADHLAVDRTTLVRSRSRPACRLQRVSIREHPQVAGGSEKVRCS